MPEAAPIYNPAPPPKNIHATPQRDVRITSANKSFSHRRFPFNSIKNPEKSPRITALSPCPKSKPTFFQSIFQATVQRKIFDRCQHCHRSKIQNHTTSHLPRHSNQNQTNQSSNITMSDNIKINLHLPKSHACAAMRSLKKQKQSKQVPSRHPFKDNPPNNKFIHRCRGILLLTNRPKR